jgi:hypothetical protein
VWESSRALDEQQKVCASCRPCYCALPRARITLCLPRLICRSQRLIAHRLLYRLTATI